MNVAGLSRRGARMAAMFFVNGGLGAAGHRDGPPTLSFPSNVSNTPVEIMETVAPLRVLEKRLMPDSGGRGKHRGGLGQRVAFQNLSSRLFTLLSPAIRSRL